ncbi:hypothetical protein [Saccharopolyspora sp. NPDC002578]
MSDSPELDQVAEMRRKLAAHAQYPLLYWALLGVVVMLVSGLPIWSAWLPDGGYYLQWAMAAIALGSALYARRRRSRTGVHLPKRSGSYPSAWPFWVISLVILAVGFAVVTVLVRHDQLVIALLVLPILAVGVVATEFKTRAMMARDIEEGRVRS